MTVSNLSSSAFQQKNRSVRDYQRGGSGSVFTSYRVVVPGLQSCWALELEDRLAELVSLPVGWDGYRGKPVAFQCAYFVVNMLESLCNDDVPSPSLVPGSDGSLQVEWHINGYDVELDVLGPQKVVASRFNHRDGKEEVIDIENDFIVIARWIDDLAAGEFGGASRAA